MFDDIVLTVSQLNSYIKLMFQGDKNLRSVLVSGEIFDFRRNASSGHVYFSLKENKNVIRAIMFASDFMRINFIPEDGMAVIIRAGVSVYEVSGQYQLYVKNIMPFGVGKDYAETEKLKEKLKEEGLFDDDRKKKIAIYPQKLGVITSASGAVVHDIKNVVKRRYPFCNICTVSVRVQGENAEKGIINAIEYFNSIPNKPDTIIIARGGGSAEDLRVFNREGIARAVCSSVVPIISAIGHETDWTICDYVADKRAPTPSAAAEMAVPDRYHLMYLISSLQKRLIMSFENIINGEERKIVRLGERLKINCPKSRIDTDTRRLLILKEELKRSLDSTLVRLNNKIDSLKYSLEPLHPIKTILRGYTLVDDGEKSINKVDELKEGQEIRLRFADGSAYAVIKNVRRENIGRED